MVSNYKDITEEWIKLRSKDGVIKDAKSIKLKGKEYFVNKKNRINHKNNEIHIAKLLIQAFGGNFQYLPDIGEDDGVRCGDFLYKNVIWDLKELGPNVQSKVRAVDNALKASKDQSNNFILDITTCKLDRKNIIKQVEKIYSTKNREWIDKIIIFDNDKLLRVYERNKKEVDTLSKSGVGPTS